MLLGRCGRLALGLSPLLWSELLSEEDTGGKSTGYSTRLPFGGSLRAGFWADRAGSSRASLPSTLSGIIRWLGKDMALMYAGAGALGMLNGEVFPAKASRQISDAAGRTSVRTQPHTCKSKANASLYGESYIKL